MRRSRASHSFASIPGYRLLVVLVAIAAVTFLVPPEVAVTSASAEETTSGEDLDGYEEAFPDDRALAEAIASTLPDDRAASTGELLQTAEIALQQRQDRLGADSQDVRAPLLAAQSANLDLASRLAELDEAPTPEQEVSLDVARQALDHRELLAHENPTLASLPSLVEDQHAKLDASEQLTRLLAQDHDSQAAEAVALAQQATRHQAERLGLDWQEPSLPSHASPSQAIAQLLDRHDAEASPEQHQRIDELDQLPRPLRSSLTDLVDAFLALEQATDQAYADANTTRAQQWRDANPNEALADLEQDSRRFVDEMQTITEGLASGELTPREAQQALATQQQALSDGVPDEDAAQVLADAGIDLAPVLPARNALLEATLAFQEAWSANAQQTQQADVSVPPAVSIDLSGEDSTYEADVALQIDVAGNDTYRNNAGGSNLEDGTCSLKDPAAAALVDLDGDDEYEGTRGCGAAGGGYLGTGFLFDAAGEDRYTPEGGWAPIREGQIDTRLQDVPDVGAGAASQDEQERFVVGFHEGPDLAPGDTFEGAEVLEVLPTVSAVSVDASGVEGFRADLAEDPDVRYVERDGIVEASGGFTPDDPLFDEQYGIEQIQAPSAWGTTTGGDSKDLCVVDTGVDFEHPDLNGTRWKGGVSTQMASDGPRDDNGHGTHVTGIAAATIDNGEGVAGVGNVGFLAAKGLSSIGSGFDSEIAEAITWCADEGADVISMSLGSASSATVISDALDHAWDEGALLVAAAGNEGCYGCVEFPASHEHVIAVPCTDADRERCSFSNYGPLTEIAAPGHDVLSTLPECGGDPALCDDSGYGTLNGTSMSTPFVSGAATLVWNEVPELTNAQMRQLLRDVAVDHVLGEDFDEPGCRPEVGYGVVDVDALLQAAEAGQRPELQDKIPCTLNPGSWGTNGGGAVAGTGLLVDAGGDDGFLGEDFGTNGGGYMNGVGLLVSLAGNDTFQAGNDGTNGGATTATGALVTGDGDDTYQGGSFGTNGGGAWARLAPDLDSPRDGFQQGSGFLFDASGDDTYEGDIAGANGGAYWASTGFIFDALGDDTYRAERGSVNGGGEIAGVGTVVDALGDDRYVATSLHARGANGGGYRAGAGYLVDGAGSNAFEAGWSGANGGAWTGSSFLYAGGSGDDTFKGCGRGTMGGGFASAGFLFNAGGDNTYTDFPRCALLTWEEPAASNGGGYSIGTGFLMDLGGNDRYQGPQTTNGGTDLWGVAMLLDGGGDDTYSGEVKGVNGGAWGLGQAFLVDAGLGDDTYLAEGWGANGGGGGVLGGEDLPLTTHGFLADQGGDDTYGDDQIPITEPSTGGAASSDSGPLDLPGPDLASSGEARSFVVGFEQLPTGVEVGDEVADATVDRLLPGLEAAVLTTRSPATFQAAVDDLPEVAYVQEDHSVDWVQATEADPDDPWSDWQTGLENTRLPEAWNTTFGDPGVELCLVDTGLWEDHVDIGNVLDGADLYEGGTDTTDGFGHGTHVAGVAAALSDNGFGITGASEASLLVAKVTDDDGVGSFASAADGIRWCADQGADIINLSIGGDHHPLMQEAVGYAWEQGSLLVASGGNAGGAVDYPAAYPEVVSVGCTDVNDARCSFSPMGRELDVTAPGIDIFGTVPTCDGGVDFCHYSGYTYATGTSSSTAFVSGIAALALSVNPDASNCELKQVLRETANGTQQGGHAPRYGFGVADAKAAMDRVQAGDLPGVCPGRGPMPDLGVNGGGFNYGRGFLYDASGDDTYKAGGNGANGGAVDAGAGFLYDGAGGDTYLDDEAGTGVDRTLVPKGTGVQIDAPADPLPIVNPRLADGYRSLSEAFEQAAPGDTLLVREGGHEDAGAVLATNAQGQTLDGLTLCPTGPPVALDLSVVEDPLSAPSDAPEPPTCEPDVEAVIEMAATGNGPLLAVQAEHVEIHDLTFSGPDTLLRLEEQASQAHVHDNRIVSQDTADGAALVVAGSPDALVEDNLLHGTPGQTANRGLWLQEASDPIVRANTIAGFPTGLHAENASRASLEDNTLQAGLQAPSASTGIHLQAGQDHTLDANEVHGAATGILVDGTSDVAIQQAHLPGTTTGVRLSASDAGQPTQVSLEDNQLALAATPLVLDGTTQGLHIEAPCNDWGAYHSLLIDQRIDDQGTANTVTVEPWLGPTPAITEATTDCLLRPQAAFSIDPEQATRLEEVSFTDESQEGNATIVAWDWAFGDGTTSTEQNPTHTYDTVGTHEVRLTVEDAYGMTSTTTRTLEVTNLAPAIQQAPNKVTGNHTDALNLTVTASDEDDDAEDLALTATGTPLQQGATFTDNGDGTATFAWTPSPTHAGEHTLTVTAEDPHGATDATTIVLEVLDHAPEIAPIPNEATRLDDTLTFTVTAEDPDGDPVRLTLAQGPENAAFDVTGQDTPSPEGTLTWTPTSEDAVGEHPLVFEATSHGRTTNQSMQIDVGPANTPPDITVLDEDDAIVTSLEREAGTTLELTLAVADPDGPQTPTLTAETTPTLTDEQLTITDEETDGHNLTARYEATLPDQQLEPIELAFTADDGAQTTQATLALTTLHAPQAQAQDPLVDTLTAPHSPAIEGEAVHLRAQASDLDGDVDALAFDVGPGEPISASPSGDEAGLWVADEAIAPSAGTLTYDITVTDDEGLASTRQAELDIVANPGPQAAFAEDPVTVSGGLQTIHLDATPSEHPLERPIEIDWTLPTTGVGTSEGSIAQWVPPAAGAYEATITVTDALGATDTATLSILAEDAIALDTKLLGEAGIHERPLASTLVVDEAGLPLAESDVWLNVTHTDTSLPVTSVQRTTGERGVLVEPVPWDTDQGLLSPEAGANLPGEHVLTIEATRDSDVAFTPDVLQQQIVHTYTVEPEEALSI